MVARDDAKAVAPATRLPYVQSIAGCLPGAIGEHGLSEAELASWLAKLAPHLSRLADDDALNRLPLLLVPEETADIDRAAAALAKLSAGAKTIDLIYKCENWNLAVTANFVKLLRPLLDTLGNVD